MASPKKSGRVHTRDLTTLTKKTLSSEVAALSILKGVNLPEDQILAVTNTIIDTIKSTLLEGTAVRLRTLGCLTIFHHKERKGVRNPKTKESTVLAPYTSVKLRKSRTEKNMPELGVNGMAELLKEKYPDLLIDDLKTINMSLVEIIKNINLGKTRIEIRGFGVFFPSYVAARKTRNPKTGESVNTPGKYVIHFNCSDSIDEYLTEKFPIK